jgi:hypothetical protein
LLSPSLPQHWWSTRSGDLNSFDVGTNYIPFVPC